MPSLDPFEDNPPRPAKAAGATGPTDNIEVAPGLEQSPSTIDTRGNSSWSALEAAGLLPKKGIDAQGDSPVDKDGWPTETTPSGTVRSIPPPPPPAPPASRATAASSARTPTPPPVRSALQSERVVPAQAVVAPVGSSPSSPAPPPTPTPAAHPSPAPISNPAPSPAPPTGSTAATATIPALASAVSAANVATAPAVSESVAPRARVIGRPVGGPSPSSLIRGPRVVGRTVGRRQLFGRRPRVRKVSRVVRRIDGWTVFKISLVLYALLYVILVIAGVLLWHLAYTTGTVDNIQGFIKELFGLKTFVIDGKKLFQASRTLGLVMAIGGTGLHVTLAVLFNLIADLVGGVRVTVLEEEVILRERDRDTAAAQSD